MGQVDWQINKSSSECNRYILENEVDCDVSFKVGADREVIKAHKLILRTRSPVFDRMFNGLFCESQTDPVLPDVTPVAFKAILRYCYYDCLGVDAAEALTVPYAAKKYMLPILETAARKTVIQNLDDSTLWEVMKYSTSISDDDLHAGCITHLKENLSSSNLLDAIKYADTTGNKQLHAYCRSHFRENLSVTNILDVTKYIVSIGDEKLHFTCRDYLKRHLSGSNIWQVYKYALDEENTGLLQHCRAYFQRGVVIVREALQSEEFLNIQYEVLLDILRINDKVDERGYITCTYQIDILGPAGLLGPQFHEKGTKIEYTPGISIAEIELFKACNKWAEKKCVPQKMEPNGPNKRTVLGECLSLIRFPTMLQKDLVTIVYPTGILTQAGVVNLGRYMYRDLGNLCPASSSCQVDFPSGERRFLVTPLERRKQGFETVFIESDVRVRLSRVWVFCAGSPKVIVTNERSQRSWSMVFETKHENHFMEFGSCRWILNYIDIEPQVLEAGSKYAVTVRSANAKPFAQEYNRKGVKVKREVVPYKEVKITQDSGNKDIIYGLTLSLV